MNDSSKYLPKELIRPNWNCGRYYKIDDNRYALLYNLLEGMAYFFEQESADIIGIILRFPKNGLIPLQALFESVPSNISKDEVIDFCNELISVGLLTDGFLTNEAINHNRRIIGDNRCKSAMEIDRTIQERLPFQQNEAEDIYMDIIEKYRVPFVVMFELTYSCNEKCVHCFNPGAARNDSEHSTRSNRDEINIIHYEKLLNELQQMGFGYLY
jgi:hypothetical protein